MAILKCKMCGGDILLSEDKTVGTCDHCGSTMTFPRVSDEQKLNLYNRANHFRRQNEFDKAITYDIMAYVTHDADKVVITDTLVDALEFSKVGKGEKGIASVNPAEVVARVAVKEKNDHTANSTVADADEENAPRVLSASAVTNSTAVPAYPSRLLRRTMP